MAKRSIKDLNLYWIVRKRFGGLYRRYCPPFFQSRFDITRAKPYWYREGVIFIHVPKVAGMSISDSLYGKPLGHISAREVREICPDLLRTLFSFALVRNPIDRFFSAIRFCQQNEAALKSSPGLPADFELFRNPKSLIQDWLLKQNLHTVDFVFRPQHLFICDEEGNYLVDHVGHVERLKETIDLVQSRIGFKLVVGHLNSTEKDISPSNDGTDPELVDLVYAVYEKDFQIFDYRPQS